MVDQIIDDIIRREGGFVNHPADRGGRTIYGISEHFHPEEWRDGPPTLERAREIYAHRYIVGPKFDQIPFRPLMEQLVDYGVNSGPQLAIMKLQSILGPSAGPVDGIIGPKTLAAVCASNPIELNNRLVIERLKMLGRLIQRNRSQAAFAAGWINRATEFFLV